MIARGAVGTTRDVCNQHIGHGEPAKFNFKMSYYKYVTIGIYLIVSIPLFHLVYHASQLVIDEEFHLRQGQHYCNGSFDVVGSAHAIAIWLQISHTIFLRTYSGTRKSRRFQDCTLYRPSSCIHCKYARHLRYDWPRWLRPFSTCGWFTKSERMSLKRLVSVGRHWNIRPPWLVLISFSVHLAPGGYH